MRRRLPGPKKDIYAVPESPEEPTVKLTQPERPGPRFSLLRADKQRQPGVGKATQRIGASDLLKERKSSTRRLTVPDAEFEKEQSPKATPRRSPRNRASDGVLSGTLSSGKAVRSTRSTSKHQDVAAEHVEAQHANANDDEMVPNKPLEESAEEVELDVAATSHGLTQTPEKRGRGRPPKSKKGKTTLKEKAPTSSSRSARRSTKPGKSAIDESASQQDVSISYQEGEKIAGMVRPVILRKSEMRLSTEGRRDALEDTDEEEEAESIQGRTKKRKASPVSSTQAIKSKKRSKRSPAHDTDMEQPETSERNEEEGQEEVEDNGEEVEEIDKLRLFGQGWKLDEIYENLSQVGQSHRNGEVHPANIDRNDEDVKAVHRLCKEAKNALNQLKSRVGDSQSLADPPEEFRDIELGVQRLCTSNAKDEEKAGEIYFYTIPALVRLLKDTLETYEAIDGDNDGNTQTETITVDHLKTAIDLIAIILKMGEGALEYSRPDPTHAVVRPVRYGILKPLKRVRVNFLAYLEQIERDQARARRQAIARAETARQERQEQIERENREREDRVRAEWLQLHDERRYVEPFGPAEKLRHLRMPDPPIECDQNDEQYVRVELFKRRLGPHPVYVKKALEQVWSEEEIAALEHGLREFAGPRVFQDIFRAHCGRKGALSKYNVTEIVTTAADMRDHLAAEQMEEVGEVEDWVKQIPVWVKIPTSSGQENASSE